MRECKKKRSGFLLDGLPGDEGEDTLEVGYGEVGPGELGEGGGEHEACYHRHDADAEDDGIVRDDADGVDGVAVEHIDGLWQNGKDHDARVLGGDHIVGGEKQCGEELREEAEYGDEEQGTRHVEQQQTVDETVGCCHLMAGDGLRDVG